MSFLKCTESLPADQRCAPVPPRGAFPRGGGVRLRNTQSSLSSRSLGLKTCGEPLTRLWTPNTGLPRAPRLVFWTPLNAPLEEVCKFCKSRHRHSWGDPVCNTTRTPIPPLPSPPPIDTLLQSPQPPVPPCYLSDLLETPTSPARPRPRADVSAHPVGAPSALCPAPARLPADSASSPPPYRCSRRRTPAGAPGPAAAPPARRSGCCPAPEAASLLAPPASSSPEPQRP